jgi:hypothetical protein
MASVAMVHFGLDHGKFIHFLAGKYTGHHQDIHHTLNTVQDYVTPGNYEHINWILLNSCPAQLTFEEPAKSNKLEAISQGNSKSFIDNPQLVRKTMNKEDHYSHLVPMDQLQCKFSPYLCHTTQSIIIKEENNDQIVWDGSTIILLTDIVMNQVMSVTHKEPITFGHVEIQIYIDIYNTQISYSTAMIHLRMANIKAYFCFGRTHVDLTGAFGFIAEICII